MSIGLARACQGKRKDVGELVEGHLRSRCQLFRRRVVAPLMSIINRTVIRNMSVCVYSFIGAHSLKNTWRYL